MLRVPINTPFCSNCKHRSKVPYNQHGYAWCSILKLNVSACDPKCRQFLDRSPKAVKMRQLRIAVLEAYHMASL